MPDFDWRTEDKGPWDNPRLVVYREANQWPRWLKIIPVLFLIGVGSWLFYRQVNQWVETAVTQAQTPPLATFNLWQEAIDRQDKELFSFLLYDHFEEWWADQVTLFDQQLLFDRQALGLHLVSDRSQEIEVDLSSDLKQAHVSYQLTYAFRPGESLTKTVALQQAAFLRYRQGRWQLAPPPAGYWGQWVVDEHQYLTLIYPERDQPWGQRLVRDLNQQIRLMCTTLPEFKCPPDLHIVVRLKKATLSLVQIHNREAIYKRGVDINLPAPSLVGIPQDEIGYEALFRGYATLVVTAVITDLVEWECCHHTLFYQALLDKQLSQLDLQPWPLPATEYKPILDYYFNMGEMNALWQQDSNGEWAKSDHWLVYSFIDFLTEVAGDDSVVQMQRQLSQTSAFRLWATQFLDESLQTDEALRLAWLRFANEQAGAIQPDPPISLPLGMNLLCASGKGIYRYDLMADTWAKVVQVDPEFHTLLTPLPGDEGILLYEQRITQDQNLNWKIMWPDGRVTDLHLGQEQAAFRPVYKEAHLPGQQLMLVVGTGSADQSSLRLFDTEVCDETRCNLLPLTALPVWSPEGAYSLLSTVEQRVFSLTLADEQGRPLRLLGPGLAPFWLNGETFGYIQNGNKIVLMSVQAARGQLLLTVADLINVLPIAERPADLTIRKVYASPGDPELIFMDVVAPDQQRQYIFSYDRGSKKVVLRLQLNSDHKIMDFRLSPDGRYWTLNTHNREKLIGTDWELYLHDVARNQTRKLAFNPVSYATYSYKWSTDGRWLVKADTTFISLIAPDYDYQKLVFYEEPSCTTAVWVQGW